MSRLSIAASIACILASAGSAFATPRYFHFTMIAQTGDPRPEGGTFTTFSNPIFDGETIGFSNANGTSVYKASRSGAILRSFTVGDTAPGPGTPLETIGGFQDRSALRPARGGVPFYSWANNVPVFGAVEGIFSDIDQPNMLASEMMHTPDGGFAQFDSYEFASDNRNVLFMAYPAFTGRHTAFISFGGEIRFIADSTSVVPAFGTTLTSIRGAGDIRDQDAVIPVTTFYQGFTRHLLLRYRTSNGGVEYPVGYQNLAPLVGPDAIEIESHPTIDESRRLIFSARGYNSATQESIAGAYRWSDGGMIESLVRNGTPIPGRPGSTFTWDSLGGFLVLSASHDDVALSINLAYFYDYPQIFIYSGGQLSAVTESGAKVAGKTISYAHATRSMLVNGSLAFQATFDDGTTGIVLAEPRCAGDFNDDASVDFFDYLDFVDQFSIASSAADFNQDGTIDFFDYLDFVDNFAASC